MDPSDSIQFDRYVSGYIDALDTIDNFRDLPIEAVTATVREYIAKKYPQAFERVNAARVAQS
jgi:hypothetical protein